MAKDKEPLEPVTIRVEWRHPGMPDDPAYWEKTLEGGLTDKALLLHAQWAAERANKHLPTRIRRVLYRWKLGWLARLSSRTSTGMELLLAAALLLLLLVL